MLSNPPILDRYIVYTDPRSAGWTADKLPHNRRTEGQINLKISEVVCLLLLVKIAIRRF